MAGTVEQNDHNQDHGISAHADLSSTYWHGDPITSFSFGHGGILQVLSQKGGPGTAKMLYQEDGDVLIMAGKFQEEFTHAVPAMFWILLFQVAPCHVYI